MAILCADPRHRTKCSVVRGLQRVWWICYVISLACVNRCAAQNQSSPDRSDFATVYPTEDVNLVVGGNLELLCVALNNYTADDLKFTFGGLVLPSEKVNATTIRFFKPNITEAERYTYYCKNKHDPSQNIIRVVYVMSRPTRVTDFKCVSYNLEVLNCSWSVPESNIQGALIPTYTLTYSGATGSTLKPCNAHVPNDSRRRYCYWNATSYPPYKQRDTRFNFTLRGMMKVGDFNQTEIVDHYSVVKFAPPEELRNVSSTPHSVLLSWKVHKNVLSFFVNTGLFFKTKIEYQIAKIDNPTVFRGVTVDSVYHADKKFFFNLTNLPYAHHQYGVRLYMKPENATDEYWSEFSNLVIYTASEKPQKPPQTIAGAFDKNVFADRRVLYIYWKQIEEYDEAGANFTYRVVITQGSKSQTFEPDRSRSLGYLSLDRNQTHDVETLQAMEVRISSFNEMGASSDSAYLYIPAENDTKSLQLSSFTKLTYGNGTYELSWSGNNIAIDNYTLFWCQHNTTNVCSGRINYTVIEPTKNKHIIHLPKMGGHQFALSANKGLKSSGMVWAKCDISKDAIAMYDFPLHFMDHDAAGKTFVKLKWSMDCTLKEGIINGYKIKYCPVKGTSTKCDDSLGVLPTPIIIDNPKQMEATIKNLRPYTTYQFEMALLTFNGEKPENVTVSITTTEDAPTEPRNISITDVQANSLSISWKVPEHLNAHSNSITYIIYCIERETNTVIKERERNFSTILNKLKPFTNYTISLQACNEGINACSNQTEPILVRTRIGAPGTMSLPLYNNNILSWTPPNYYGGDLNGYQIMIFKDAKEEILLNLTTLSYEVTSCGGGMQNVTYKVRAFNIDNSKTFGAWTNSSNVTLPKREGPAEIFYGIWSDERTVLCKENSLFLLFVIMGVLVAVGVGCGTLKLYKKVRKMEDIKPEFPKELFLSEKAKFPFSGIYPTDKDEKPTSDEMLLLPNGKESIPSSEIKNSENDNCSPSEHTNSTGISDASPGPVDRQNSTSDESTHSSQEGRPELRNGELGSNSSNSDADSSAENSPYFSDNKFKKNITTGYVQPITNPETGYVQTVPATFKPTQQSNITSQPTTSSYVMAGPPAPIFTSGVLSPSGNQPLPATGYVRAEDIEARNAMNFPRLGPSPTKVFGSESLPTMPNLPPPTKPGTDSSYIQLQSLDGLPSHKPTVRNTVPFKPAASSGYVRPEDAIINKHLNLLSSSQPSEESAILDPTMSPDAYCRFSWSVDPSNDNLHSLLANPPAINPSKN